MKKIWIYIKTIFLNPIILILFFTIIGCVTLVVLEDSQNAFEYFLSCIGIGISAAVAQCAVIQNRIQKDNIKIQLFDKRYSVFQNVLDSISIINRNNWDRYILFSTTDINKEIIQIEENMYKSVQLSVCLFDKELHNKLLKVNNAFCEVTKSYKNMLTANIQSFKSHNNLQEYIPIINSYILSKNGLNSNEYENSLKNKFPDIYSNILEFSKDCDTYINFIEESSIIQDFRKYIIVDKLDE